MRVKLRCPSFNLYAIISPLGYTTIKLAISPTLAATLHLAWRIFETSVIATSRPARSVRQHGFYARPRLRLLEHRSVC